MDNELALRLFVSVVEESSFSRGGARLGVPQSTTSRMITRLEERLGARLLQRSTRKLTLTEAGQIYFERASRIAVELDEAAEAIREVGGHPSGLLRIAAPSSFGREYVVPALKGFYDLYPDIIVGLALNDSVEDFIGLGYDVAIRLGDLEDSGLIARRLGISYSCVCASPDYIRQNGMPRTPEALDGHNCLQFRTNPGHNTWRFVGNGERRSVTVSGSFFAADGDALMEAALSGLGICSLPEWLMRCHLDAGRLMRVVADYELASPASPIQAVMGYRQHVPAKQRVFIEYIQRHLASFSWLQDRD